VNKCWGLAPGDNFFRYVLSQHETTSLYRTISAELGIPQRSTAQDNLDSWFCAEKPHPPSHLLTESCLHYEAHVDGQTDRFSIVISTPEQQAMAWRYGHNKQVLMDLMFGFCSGCALLCILMAIDDRNKGIPIAFIVFTARKNTKATHADYNTKLLDDLLSKFKTGLGTNEAGEPFNIAVAGTDNDTCERTSISSTRNWPMVLLLLCIFHILQCWHNSLKRFLACIPKGDNREEVRK